uniref:ATP binding protein n=1 Tax=Arundo donax TaxID=35708 RepID=A0A0A9DF95_ARUDO
MSNLVSTFPSQASFPWLDSEKNAHWHKIVEHIQRVTLWCIATVRLSHLHLELKRLVIAEGVEGEDDLGDNRVRVRVGAARLGGGGGRQRRRRRRGLLPGAGDDGGTLHEPHRAVGAGRLQVLRLLGHRHGGRWRPGDWFLRELSVPGWMVREVGPVLERGSRRGGVARRGC